MAKKERKTNITKNRILPLVLMLAVILASVPVFDIVPDVQAAVLQLNKTSKKIEKGKSFTLWVGTKTWNKYDKEYYLADRKTPVTWKSSNTKVATVSKKGKVTAKGIGNAVITAKAGGKKLTCKVTVARPVNKKLIRLEKIKTADWLVGYKITNNNDFTVEFSLRYEWYQMDPENGYRYYWEKEWNVGGGSYVLAPGETAYTADMAPSEAFIRWTDGTTSKYPANYYWEDSGAHETERYAAEGKTWKDEDGFVTLRTYKKMHTIIKNFKKSDRKSAVSKIKVTVKTAGNGACTMSVTNNSKIKVTDMCIECRGLNEKGEVDRVIGVFESDFTLKGLEPGKTYTAKVGGPDTNWEGYFGDGKPDQIVIHYADNVPISY